MLRCPFGPRVHITEVTGGRTVYKEHLCPWHAGRGWRCHLRRAAAARGRP